MEPRRITSSARADKSILVRNDCTGSPECAVEIRLYRSESMVDFSEIHLTAEEGRDLALAIVFAIVERSSGKARP